MSVGVGSHLIRLFQEMLVADVAVLLGLAFSLFWAATRVNAYYFMSLEEAIADFKSIVLPADADASVIRGFANTAITVFYGAGERRTWMLVHVAAGSLLTALLAFQVTFCVCELLV